MADWKTGGEVDSYCGKCKLTLAHTIEAMVGAKIARVHCNTCGAQHGYRGKPDESSPARRKATRAKSTAGSALKASDYDKLMEGRTLDKKRLYSAKSHFSSGDVLEHTKFGLGLVTALKGPKKIEVIFPDGPRILVHAPAA